MASDAGKRIAYEMTMHTLTGHAGCWASFRLQDGRAFDHVAYETRAECVRHANWDRDNVIYLEVSPDGMTADDADDCLAYARLIHDLGFRIPAPDFEYDPTMPILPRDRIRAARHLARA